MRKRFSAVIMAAFFIALTAAPVYAAESNLIREYTFKTTDEDFSYTENAVIEVEGRTYEATEISYELVSEEQRIEHMESYTGLASEDVPETITTEDGTELTLEDVRYTPRTVSNVQVYRDYVVTPDIPETITFTAEGQSISGTRVATQRSISESYNVPFSVEGTFYGDEDCMYYLLDGKQIPAVTAPDFDRYQEELLSYLELDTDIYRIDSGIWSSDYYTASSQTARDATYSGMQRSNTYTVTYEGTLYDAEAVYSNGIEGGDTTYTVNAIVSYERAGLSTEAIVLIGAGVVILAGLVIAILALLKKKKKTQTEEK